MPQGYLAAGDAYTRRYDEIIKDVPNKVKIIDDTLLYDSSIENSFFHTWDYLKLCEDNGITVNEPKFVFCEDTVEFGGLKLTPSGICPSETIINAIKNFPTPKNITDARSWFGIVNQIAWSYSNADIMQPFRELVKPSSKFYWDGTLEKLFQQSKDILIQRSSEESRLSTLQEKPASSQIGAKKASATCYYRNTVNAQAPRLLSAVLTDGSWYSLALDLRKDRNFVTTLQKAKLLPSHGPSSMLECLH